MGNGEIKVEKKSEGNLELNEGENEIILGIL